MARRSAPAPNKCVAKLWHSECISGPTASSGAWTKVMELDRFDLA